MWSIKFFKKKDNCPDIPALSPDINHAFDEKNIWFVFEPSDPPTDVVLASVYTEDCGWVMHTVYYNTKKKCWYFAGTLKPIKSHLEYTHWHKLPDEPQKPLSIPVNKNINV